MHKIIFTIIFLFSLAPSARSQEAMHYPTLYPSARGSYNTLKLEPQSANLPTPCVIGTMYTNSAGKLQYCIDDGAGSGIWVDNAGSVWQQSSGVIYPINPNPNIKVAVGVSAPDLEFHVANGGILAIGGTETSFPSGAGIKLFWNPNKNAFRAGRISGAQWDDANVGAQSTVIGGEDNIAQGSNSSVLGGTVNSVTSADSFIGGGLNNSVQTPSSAILGGRHNAIRDIDGSVAASNNFIGAGKTNSTDNMSSAVVAGELNDATENQTFVGAGYENDVDSPNAGIIAGDTNKIIESAADSALNAFIAAGQGNQVDGQGASIVAGKFNRTTKNYAFIAAGLNNTNSGRSSAIMAGQNNIINDTLTPGQAFYSFIGAGQNNSVDGRASSIVAGNNNQITKSYAFIGTGENNAVHGTYSAIVAGANNIVDSGAPGNSSDSFIGAGENNTIDGNKSSITAGTNNQIDADYSFIGAGDQNSIRGDKSTILAGELNNVPGLSSFIGAGYDNCITGNNSTILGGQSNFIGSDNAFAGGRNIIVEDNAHNTFAWGHSNTTITITDSNVFVIATGNVGFGNTNPGHMLELSYGAYTDGATWVTGSSREYKENIKPLEAADAMKAFKNLQPIKFHYKTDKKEEYLGFIAEDVPDLLATKDRKGLNPIEFTAVLTKVMQEQEKQIQDQKKRIETLQEKLKNF